MHPSIPLQTFDHRHIQHLQSRLSAFSKEELLTCITELTSITPEAWQHAVIFSSRNNPDDLLSELIRLIDIICSESECYRWNQLHNINSRLGRILERIETDLLHQSPTNAILALVRFLQSDASIFERADDDGYIGMTYIEACEMLHFATSLANHPQWALDAIFDLIQHDDYGVRRHLRSSGFPSYTVSRLFTSK